MKNKSLVIFCSLLMVAFAACKTAEKSTVQQAPSKTKAKSLSEEERITLEYLFVDAIRERNNGNLDKAAEMFAQCIRIDGTNYASMYEVAQIYRYQNKLSEALFFAQGAAEGDPSNVWYQILYADLLLDARKLDEAARQYKSLFDNHPDRIEFGFSYAGILTATGKETEAIKVYDAIEKETGVSEDITREKQRLYLRLGKTEKAAEEVEKLIAQNPRELRYYSMLTELYQSAGMPEKAYEVIEQMKAMDPDSPQVFLALAEYYRQTNQKEKSFEQLKLAFGSPELSSEVKMRILSSYLPLLENNPEMLSQGTELGKILADTHPDEAIAVSIYGDFLSMNNRFEEAEAEYKKSIGLDSTNFTVWQQLFICQAQTSNFEEMLSYSDKARELFPEQAIVYFFHGTALEQTKEYEGAVKSYTTGYKLVADNEDLLFRFYSGLGNCYNELKSYNESDEFFEKALKINPEDAFVLNNYSYFLSVRGVKLDKAAAMSKKSNNIHPNESSFEDTYAWVLYKQGQYESAKQWLEKALKNGGDSSPTILEHMGDVLFRLGKTAQAVEYWNLSKKAGGEGELLDKKIRDKKLYE